MIIKKGSGVRRIFLLLLGLLLFIPFIHAVSYNSSRPIIEVSYHEIPVTITAYSLKDIFNASWHIFPVNNALSGDDVYNFTVNYLSNGNYTFFIRARDQDNNVVDAYKDFEIGHKGMKVWLSDPIPAIGKKQVFNISVKTQVNATCKYGLVNPLSCTNQTCRFQQIPNPFSLTGNKTEHRIIDYSAPSPDTFMYVICRIDIEGTDFNNDESYGDTHFMVGYDLNKPNITSIVADPNPVVDINLRKTQITVLTNEPAVCKINGGNSGVQNGMIDTYFPDENLSVYLSYKTEHVINVSYYDISDPISRDFKYNINCYDRAKWNDMKNLTVKVILNTSLTISQVTPRYVTSKTITYEIKTNIIALNCNLRLNTTSDWMAMTQNNPKNFTYPGLGLKLGSNKIQVFCYSDSNTFANFTVIADDEKPVMDILADTETCGLESIDFELNASDNGSGIDKLYFRIENSTDILRNWTTAKSPRMRFNYRLVDGEKYTISGYAVDKAELESEVDSVQITANEGDSIACDFSPPTLTLNVTGNTYKKSVNIICKDVGSGCLDSFQYFALENIKSSCGNITYSSILYSSLPIELTKDVRLCIRASDKNNNTASLTDVVYVQTAACGNNVVDPEESCDGNVLGKFTCKHFGFDSGLLYCNPPNSTNECEFNTDNCGMNAYGYCGDGKINNLFWEQCDGNDWGKISKTNGCKQFGFDSGTLRCNPSTFAKGVRCIFNTSQCVKSPVNNNPKCDGSSGLSTTLLDPGEQCEPSKAFTLNCSDFDNFGQGSLTCENDCFLDISGCKAVGCEDNSSNCTAPPVVVQQCQNNNLEPGEQCDGGLQGIIKNDFIELLDCDSDVYCTSSCKIDCLLGTNTCSNLVKDGDETSKDCGGSCPSCKNGDVCKLNSDCVSGLCSSGICMETPCSNGEKDNDETDIDCGGASCSACSEGEACSTDDDCQSGKCIEGVCAGSGEVTEEEKSNLIGLILLIVGIVLFIAGLGYIIYETYFSKSKPSSYSESLPNQTYVSQEPIVQDPKVLELQKQKIAGKRQQQESQRKSLLEGFDKEDTGDLKKIEEKASETKKSDDGSGEKSEKKADKETEYVDLSEDSDNTSDKSSASIFDKLKNLGKPEDKKSKQTESEESESTNAGNKPPAQKDLVRSRKSKIIKVSKKSGTFKKLETITSDPISNQISEISGNSQSSVNKMLDHDSIPQDQINNMFSGLDKQQIMSDSFKEIMAELVKKGKLDKDKVSAMLFEYIDNGIISKSDVAKIMTGLKLI